MIATRRVVPIGLVLLGACVAATSAGAVNAPCTQEAPNTPSGSKTYSYSSKPQLFPVPAGVSRVLAVAEGAHGGQGHSTAPGGAGGGAEAYIPVSPGDCLVIEVGQYTNGSGGRGYARGGAQGTTNGGADGNSSGAGGGASAVSNGGFAWLVGAGGGGGGGDGSGTYGGAGGNGGLKASGGKGGGETQGGSGGCGGCGHSFNGDSGDSAGAETEAGSGGGGGGGYLKGGKGGDAGTFNGGGGGGGAGTSFVAKEDHPIPGLDPLFISGRKCPRGHVVPTCNGSVLLRWDTSTTGAIAPDEPAVRILSDDRDSILEDGLPITHATSGGPLRLELHIRGDGVKKPEVVEAVDSGPEPTRHTLELSPGAATRVEDKRNVQLRLRAVHPDGTTVQRVLLH